MLILDNDNSTTYAPSTPPESVATDIVEASTSSVPWPGFTFIIKSAALGEFITLLRGKITLASPNSRGSIYWECIET
jgi:hypothetical protein